MEADRIKWNRRFLSQESFLSEGPSSFLVREIARIECMTPGRRALDIACGEGRNSNFLALRGFTVTGLDISDAGLAKAGKRAEQAGVAVDFRRLDLDDYRIGEEFDLIINFNFLLRKLIPDIVAALASGGVIVFDSIRESPEMKESHNPDYLLRQGELRQIFEQFDGEIVVEEEVQEGEMPTARLIFKKAEKKQVLLRQG